jgi:hypothetical protein
MHGPLFLLELAVAATCAEEHLADFGTRTTSFAAERDPEVPSSSPQQRAERCKEVQAAMEFLLTSSTPQVSACVLPCGSGASCCVRKRSHGVGYIDPHEDSTGGEFCLGLLGRLLWYRPGLSQCRFRML